MPPQCGGQFVAATTPSTVRFVAPAAPPARTPPALCCASRRNPRARTRVDASSHVAHHKPSQAARPCRSRTSPLACTQHSTPRRPRYSYAAPCAAAMGTPVRPPLPLPTPHITPRITRSTAARRPRYSYSHPVRFFSLSCCLRSLTRRSSSPLSARFRRAAALASCSSSSCGLVQLAISAYRGSCAGGSPEAGGRVPTAAAAQPSLQAHAAAAPAPCTAQPNGASPARRAPGCGRAPPRGARWPCSPRPATASSPAPPGWCAH